MKCGRCGAENPAQNVQCWNCGLPFYTDMPGDYQGANMPQWQPPMLPYPKRKISTGWLIFYISSAVVALVLLIAIIIVAITPARPPVVPDNIPNEVEAVGSDSVPSNDDTPSEAIADMAQSYVPADKTEDRQNQSPANNDSKNVAENAAQGKIAEVDKAEAEAKAKADKAKANASKNSKGNTNSKEKSKESTGEAKKEAAQEQPKAPSTSGSGSNSNTSGGNVTIPSIPAIGGSGSNSNTNSEDVTIPSIPDGGENSKENLEIEKPKVLTEENTPGIRR